MTLCVRAAEDETSVAWPEVARMSKVGHTINKEGVPSVPELRLGAST